MNFDAPGDDKPNGHGKVGTPGQTGSPSAPAHDAASSPGAAESGAAGEKLRLSLQTGGREPGSAGHERREWAPHSVQDMERHGLELVTSAAGQQEDSSGEDEGALSEEELHTETAARMMQAIEDEVDQIRRGAGRLIEFHPADEVPLQRIGARLGRAFSRLKACSRQMTEEKPLRMIAAVVALGFAVGAALGLRKGRK